MRFKFLTRRTRVGVTVRVKDRSGISVEGKNHRFVLLEKKGS